MSQINARLNELNDLWVGGTSAGMQHIPALCGEIAEMTMRRGLAGEVDRNLLRRVAILSATAESRLAACVAIQTRTGTYSMRGAFEFLPRVATSDWEG